MNQEYGFPLAEVGEVYVYLAVEAARTQQSLVEDVHAVGGGQYDHAAVGAEAVHLGEQLIERVLALVVAAHRRVLAAGAAHGVYLVDKDDGRCFLLGLAEQVAHAAGAHAHEHLDEITARDGEERHVCLAGHGFGQQRLACARRTD